MESYSAGRGKSISIILLCLGIIPLTVSTPSPPSKTLGSIGTGPSIAHRLLSYLLLMNDSILLHNHPLIQLVSWSA